MLSLPVIYNAMFPISGSKIEPYLEQHLGVHGVKIVKTIDIDNKKIVLYEFSTDYKKLLGDAELTRGITNKYKFNRTGYNQSIVRNRILETSRGKYLLVIGENREGKLGFIQAAVRETIFTGNIPSEEYFAFTFSLPKHTVGNFADLILLKSKSGTIVYENNIY